MVGWLQSLAWCFAWSQDFMAFVWVGTMWAGGLEFLGPVLMPRWEAGVQSLVACRAMSGAESWWVQGLGGCRALVGVGPFMVQSFVRCITLVWCRALEVVSMAIPVWRLSSWALLGGPS